MTEEITVDPVETTEVDVDPLITTKLAYVDNLKNEIEGIQEQLVILQYQLDIRVTALAVYQSALTVKGNGKDEEVKYTEKDLGDGLKKGIKADESNS